ncbi:DUF2752 domain-containing protein [Cryptosporangium aurantiacum]|uniref:DUF2752 domain-containing protein n=1 Tax=Cryptosporangium aurantiacum TaxID=134849 RepID=A0A1M7IQY3_9ACTN|nr:DUF2752 domain-containing protein [Cryptosporangium aurantiacum]SHM43222.1 Protein of unknown function [Cryptosporangium aurantiacum]
MLEQAGAPGPLAPAGAPVPPPHEGTHPHDAYMWQEAPPSRIERLALAAWTKPSWLAPLTILGCIGAASTYVLTNDPTDTRLDPLGPCAFKMLTGFDCPGCGGTRMVWYLLHGDVLQAARHHLVALIAVPILAWAYVVLAAKRFFGVQLPSKRIPLVAILGFLGFWVVFAVLRNLPWAPFSWFFVS